MTSRFPRPLLVRASVVFAVSTFSVACSDSTTEPPPPPETSEITVDASVAPAFVRLGDPASTIAVANPSSSTEWDLSFFATGVTVNGGAAGPGGVTAYCLCENADATASELQAMTPANQLAAFEAVTAADIPAASSFSADDLNPAVSGWVSGTGATATAAPGKSWIIRRSNGGVILAKFRVTAVTGATATTAGSVTVEYAIQPSTGAPFGPVSTRTLDLSAGPVYLDLASGPVSASSPWDLRFSGYEIRTNGGVSGSGGVSAVIDETMPFAQISSQYAAFAPAVAYRSDSYGGVFVSSPWYKYNITGTDNQIWPNFNVYLIRRGDDVFKVQITSYYNASGTSRQITLRSVQLQ
jgi:hypothetical protein